MSREVGEPDPSAAWVQDQARAENLRLSLHAQAEMVEEDIRLGEVLQALDYCQVIEAYPEHRRGPCAQEPKPPEWLSPTSRSAMMRCSVVGCGGECEDRLVTHTVRHLGQLIVIDNVPAEVCGLCGEALLSPDTVRRIEALLDSRSAPKRTVPLYEFVA